MRKFAIPFLAVMLSLSIVACGGNPGSDNKEKTTQSDKKKDEKKSKKDKKDKKDKKNKDETEESESKNKKNKKSNSEISFDEVVAVDNDECKITITGIDPDNAFGFTLKTQLENKSSDKTYMFSIDRSIINGISCDALFAQDVAPGKKANADISFFDTDLKEGGVDEYTDIELAFNVYDNDDWNADPVALETVHIYPYGEDKATVFEREPQSSDNVILDNEYATVTVIGYKEDEYFGYTVQIYFVNKSDKNLSFSADNVSVNGFMMDPYFSASVPIGTSKFTKMYWSTSEFEENDITTVENIEFNLRVNDADDWMADAFANETITLTP